ncbi:plasmid partition protein ParG [Candidatus Williamhamiltonella defendens]|uniref:DNA partition complex ParG n=1 Tax=Candidatus Hamiltonella defensa (Bemisia tabaci) TaxID=672795 RepID=A0A249E094_9ENTR|nr:plasmid partition protein ParG [Candidatus Hamiltonella defensa]ASX26935.1 DNA partition complex ParG [Candidatus Hamiltonella defensa (Bemisia tabaci)]CED79553.1 Partitioning protein [Candidatus Hamiltonella defensa (Bemisia tabaci)]
MALTKQHTSKTMSFGEHRDLEKVIHNTPSGKQKRVNVNFDEEIHIRFKAACAKKSTSITEVIKDLVDNWLKENDR